MSFQAEFDAFRFSRRREVPGEELKHQLVTAETDYLAFGLGRHVWCVKPWFH